MKVSLATESRQTPAGNYRGLRFYFGLEPAVNHTNPAAFPPDHPLHPNLNGLHWSWQGGYIFMALEGLHRTGNAQPEGYSFHLARDPFRADFGLAARSLHGGTRA